MKKTLGQHDTILWGMINQPEKEWFSAVDFQHGQYFVGYEASARISELSYKYPTIIERKNDGRFRLVRIRWENKKEVQEQKERIEILINSQE